MSDDLFNVLEKRVVSLINVVDELKVENVRLKNENDRLAAEKVGLKSRIDAILKKLEGV